ncbi:MAG: nitrate reductase [Acidiphilium sp. 37-64-53]|uniref:NCS1 family nucleobase:cation symporter-1 n=1 Tax=Acidiphilium TaxID=522 RepID=UPI000BCD386A|nr:MULTISPECIES: NCS1 family nucleobase:cation symporter-1 [Acidiphilium]OYW01760.1 MAG: nitrate reductase [Acidiphilium sp. 37-64-53]OZB29666.1 MAG: nitrate reductase [Acidiphilium sp. 34-64-41]HQT85699.1 NCS1 family nucleobase:cation symporter-1 [Acidiphilium rubrum]
MSDFTIATPIAGPNAGPNAGSVAAPYSDRLYNDDLAPLARIGSDVAPGKSQSWTWYNIFAFWMADVHSVGGYVFAASLFASGLTGWQVLISLLIGISIVQVFANLLGKMGQQAAVPYAVVARVSFGVFGANIAAVIRGAIAVVWYGIQTYLASGALNILILKFDPASAALEKTSFLGLSELGWISFLLVWSLQAIVFWQGMESIKRFIDWAGPAVYAVMFALALWIVSQAGIGHISFNLAATPLHGGAILWQMILAIALVAGYFAGPTLNFADFARYCGSNADVRKGNFWGLPVNFLLFSIVTVVVVSGTIPVFGHMITDPVITVGKIGNTTAALLGAFTFVTATIGINIVANFVSPAFDFSNCAPSRISFRMGGMIAAVGSVFLTPWNLFNNPAAIHYTVDLLAAAIGPLYGILLADFYLVKAQKIDVPALFSDRPGDTYWYSNGFNPVAVKSVIIASLIAIGTGFVPGELKTFSLFIGGIIAAGLYVMLSRGRSDTTQGA